MQISEVEKIFFLEKKIAGGVGIALDAEMASNRLLWPQRAHHGVVG